MMKKSVIIVFAIIFIVALSVVKNVEADHAACSNKDYPQRERKHDPIERQPKKGPQTATSTKVIVSPTTVTSQTPFFSLQPEKAWQPVQGYTQGFNECLSFCNAYRNQRCSQQSALAYCNALLSVDLNKVGSINADELGQTPVGRSACEANVHCFDVIKECPCSSQSLNMGSCVFLLYSSYSSRGLSVQQAYATISQNLVGSCHQPTV